MSTKNMAEPKKLLAEADAILLGIGAGLSASAGLNYSDPGLVERWYPEYRALGLSTIFEIMSRRFWWLERCQPEEYWAFWARHIWHIRYEPEALEAYRLLYQLLEGRDYFLVSTNADGQLAKAGFPREKIFAPQGDYSLFQCLRPCTQTLYNNRDMIETMVANMPDPLHIRSLDIPLCPNCGGLLVSNLRRDDSFVEEPHLFNLPDYKQFMRENAANNLILLELGVGYNTPGIIRYPFEDTAKANPKARLIRVNLEQGELPPELSGSGLSFAMDLTDFLRELTRA